ncbi:MAG: spore maturation protein [Bacteroidetes bacterium]|nr:spore maturation protein [Bacteroidota bacterium]
MLNYIWFALIILGIGSAVTYDVLDSTNNKYGNGERLEARVEFQDDNSKEAKVTVSQKEFSEFYGVKVSENVITNARLSKSDDHYTLFLKVDDSSPAIWREMAAAVGKEDDLLGKVFLKNNYGAGGQSATMEFEPILFVKLKNVTNSLLNYAGVAVNIAIGLIGIMALWLGIIKVAEKAGLINLIAKSVRPITKFLFPDVPHDHPAVSSMVMNISANMLGLGNAATPFGIKAMEELDKLNPEKGTATNAMCTFLAINTAGLTLIPTTAIAVRAAAGSSDPTIIIGTSIFGATCATITGITAAKLFETFSGSGLTFSEWLSDNYRKLIGVLGGLAVLLFLILSGVFTTIFSFVDPVVLKTIIQVVSLVAIPLIIFSFLVYGLLKKVNIYEEFVEGAKEGFNIALRIIPYLVAMLVAIGIFRAGGAMEILIGALTPLTNLIGMPAEALPMALMRPLSGSGSIGVMTEIISVHGPDSFLGVLTSTFLGSTETTLYVLAVYFGAVNIKRTRHAVFVGLLADVAGILAALFIVNLLFG